jgi:sulfur carrier protein
MEAYLRVGFFLGRNAVMININGMAAEAPEGLSLQDLLSTKGLPDKAVIIELNGAIIRRDLWESTRLGPGDSLEIVRIIGGG